MKEKVCYFLGHEAPSDPGLVRDEREPEGPAVEWPVE